VFSGAHLRHLDPIAETNRTPLKPAQYARPKLASDSLNQSKAPDTAVRRSVAELLVVPTMKLARPCHPTTPSSATVALETAFDAITVMPEREK